MPRGGQRPGAGRPKGHSKPILDKLMAREELRRIVIEHIVPMTLAQVAQANGIKYLVVREKASGKFKRVGKSRAERLNDDEEIIEIWEKDPSTSAYADLMNRAIDKPTETVEMNVTGGLELVKARLNAARKKAAERNRKAAA